MWPCIKGRAWYKTKALSRFKNTVIEKCINYLGHTANRYTKKKASLIYSQFSEIYLKFSAIYSEF